MIVMPVKEGISLRRIAGMSGALIVHVGVFLFMAVPVRPERPTPKPDDDITVVWNDGKTFPPPPPPPKPEPIKPIVQKPVTRPIAHPQPVLVPTVTEAPIATSDLVTDDALISEPAVQAPEAPGGSYIGASVAAGYGGPPVAKYDHRLARQGIEGDVLLEVSLDANGQVIGVRVARSSGHRSLDQSAAKQVRRWTFKPAEENGQRVAATVLVPMAFRLNRT